MRTRSISSLLAALLLVAGLATGAFAADGEPAHAFPVQPAHGPRQATNPVEDLRGRVLLLVRMNPWSDRCVEAVEHLNDLHDKHAPAGLTIVGIFESEQDATAAWGQRHGVKFELACLSEQTAHKVKDHYQFPGEPWGFLIDAAGVQVATHHPQEPKFQRQIEPLLAAASKPPVLPPGFEDVQAQMDDGLYAAARTKLLEMAESKELDKVSRHWAKGVAAWIEQRKAQIFDESERLIAEGRFWDAWALLDDYPRRFEGLGGEEEAKGRAEAVRLNPDAEKDLEGGDLLVKAKERVADGKARQAQNICKRLLRSWKGTVHEERAKELLKQLD